MRFCAYVGRVKGVAMYTNRCHSVAFTFKNRKCTTKEGLSKGKIQLKRYQKMKNIASLELGAKLSQATSHHSDYPATGIIDKYLFIFDKAH